MEQKLIVFTIGLIAKFRSSQVFFDQIFEMP